MGKGSRNREVRVQERIENPKKYTEKKKKQAPKWLTPVISLVVLAAIVIGAVCAILANAGTFKRAQVLVESKSGKYDVNRQMAVYLAWQSQYYNAYYYYTYCKMGYYEDQYGITTIYSSAEDYAISVAQYALQETTRDSIDDVLNGLIQYVAICDLANEAGVKLDDADKKEIDAAVDMLKTLQDKYTYSSFNKFMDSAICKGLRARDVRKAMELVCIYEKFTKQKTAEFASAVTDEEILAYVKENAETFYSTQFLTYETETAALKDSLLAAADEEAFKKLIAENAFTEQYYKIFNQKTTLVTANADYDKIKGKTNTDNGAALTEAMTEIGATSKTYRSDDTTIEKTLSAWLFDVTNGANATTVITGEDDKIYLVAITEAKNDTANEEVRVVSVYEKVYAFVDGTTYESDANFKDEVKQEAFNRTSISDDKTLTISYKTAMDKANALCDTINAADDKPAAMKAQNAVEVTNYESGASGYPQAVIDAVEYFDVANLGKAIAVEDTDDGVSAYVLYVSAYDEANMSADFSYVTVTDDLFYQVVSATVAALNKEIPVAKTSPYNPAPTEDSLDAWLFGGIGEDFASIVKKNDTKVLESTLDEKTVYSVYMVVGDPMAKNTEMVYNGAYLKCADEDTKNGALAALEGKTGTDLTDALTAYNESTVVSEAFSFATFSSVDYNLALWFRNAERTENEFAAVDTVTGEGTNVAVFLGASENWKYSAKNGCTNTKLDDWMKEAVEGYVVNGNTLAKFGEPTPEETTEVTE